MPVNHNFAIKIANLPVDGILTALDTDTYAEFIKKIDIFLTNRLKKLWSQITMFKIEIAKREYDSNHTVGYIVDTLLKNEEKQIQSPYLIKILLLPPAT